MKSRYIFLLLAILLYAACQKKENATPVYKTVIDSSRIKDTTIQVYAYPYADTFYGAVYEGDWGVSAIPDTQAYICVYHLTRDSIRFLSNYFQRITTDVVYQGFYQTLPVNDSSYYSWCSCNYSGGISSLWNFNIKDDSLFYNNSDPNNGDDYMAYFAGKKI